MNHRYDTIISECPDRDEGSSVSVIFYMTDIKTWFYGGEPILNMIAAIGQGSRCTHCELAIGEGAGNNGEMTNVLRIFNDDEGTPPTLPTGTHSSLASSMSLTRQIACTGLLQSHHV